MYSPSFVSSVFRITSIRIAQGPLFNQSFSAPAEGGFIKSGSMASGALLTATKNRPAGSVLVLSL
jgi:hypothetical protein